MGLHFCAISFDQWLELVEHLNASIQQHLCIINRKPAFTSSNWDIFLAKIDSHKPIMRTKENDILFEMFAVQQTELIRCN